MELGIHLNGLGHESTIVEMAGNLAAKTELTERTAYMIHLEKNKVKTMVDTTCTEITDKGVWVENADGRRFLEADTVIIAVGTKPLAEERDQFIDAAFDVINVGDCVNASSIVHAVHTGFDAGSLDGGCPIGRNSVARKGGAPSHPDFAADLAGAHK